MAKEWSPCPICYGRENFYKLDELLKSAYNEWVANELLRLRLTFNEWVGRAEDASNRMGYSPEPPEGSNG